MIAKIFVLGCSVSLLVASDAKLVRQPSDWLKEGNRDRIPKVTRILRATADLREMYCDSSILRARIAKGTCVIDFAFPTEKVLEISIPTNATLGGVLKQSGGRLAKWDGTRPPSLCIIKERSILLSTGQPEFLLTPIDPGDFIVDVPRE